MARKVLLSAIMIRPLTCRLRLADNVVLLNVGRPKKEGMSFQEALLSSQSEMITGERGPFLPVNSRRGGDTPARVACKGFH